MDQKSMLFYANRATTARHQGPFRLLVFHQTTHTTCTGVSQSISLTLQLWALLNTGVGCGACTPPFGGYMFWDSSLDLLDQPKRFQKPTKPSNKIQRDSSSTTVSSLCLQRAAVRGCVTAPGRGGNRWTSPNCGGCLSHGRKGHVERSECAWIGLGLMSGALVPVVTGAEICSLMSGRILGLGT